MKRNIALIGMPLCGKTTVGRLLAAKLDMLFLDLDEYVEYELSMSIEEIFTHGETVFRAHEAKALYSACDFDNALIACGGGAIIADANRRALKESCYNIYLFAAPQTLAERNCGDRPLLSPNPVARINTLFAEREAFYLETADITIKTDLKTPLEIVDEICVFLNAL